MSDSITHTFSGLPVSDLARGEDWYTRFFGRAPDRRAGDELLWQIGEHATIFIEPRIATPPTPAAGGRVTFAVTGLDAVLHRLAAAGITHGSVETYANGVRHVDVPDPDGNAIALAEAPPAG